MMHPDEHDLIQFADSGPDERRAMASVFGHIADCAACRERVRQLEDWQAAVRDSEAAPKESGVLWTGLSPALRAGELPPAARALADRVYGEAARASRVIDLTPMPFARSLEEVRLAADGTAKPRPGQGLEHRATLYADDPELVLRIMRDPATQLESLHLIADDAALTRNVLIHIVEPAMDFLTDADGVAAIEPGSLDNPSALQWQVRLPDATFALAPLEHEPGTADKADETEIETEEGNLISVTLLTQPEGVTLRLRVVRIHGRETFDQVRLVVSQGADPGRIVRTHAAEPCTVSGLTATVPIDIRIFAD